MTTYAEIYSTNIIVFRVCCSLLLLLKQCFVGFYLLFKFFFFFVNSFVDFVNNETQTKKLRRNNTFRSSTHEKPIKMTTLCSVVRRLAVAFFVVANDPVFYHKRMRWWNSPNRIYIYGDLITPLDTFNVTNYNILRCYYF